MRHSASMKAILCILLWSAPYVLAEESADRAAIERTIAALNEQPVRPTLFTGDASASSELARLPPVPGSGRFAVRVDTGAPPPRVTISHEPWGEATIFAVTPNGPKIEILNPRIAGGPVSFITPDVATVDGTWTYNDGTALQIIPILFVMKREGADWKIASLRVLGPR